MINYTRPARTKKPEMTEPIAKKINYVKKTADASDRIVKIGPVQLVAGQTVSLTRLAQQAHADRQAELARERVARLRRKG